MGLRNSALPSARTVSQMLTKTIDKELIEKTLMLMQWGQFLDHDITLTPLTTCKLYYLILSYLGTGHNSLIS